MAVQFKLEAFQGPLDLLLHLITKHKLNICDIEISLLLEQYLEYMNQLDSQDYESAGEFLEMAARLIYIKTVSLLPQPEEAEELKKDLEGQIIEYSICKKAAEMLREDYVGNSIFVRNPVAVIVDKTYTRVHEAEELFDAYMGISAKNRNAKPLRAEIFSPIVSKRIVSVTSKIIFVLKKLYKTGVYNMAGLYEGVTDKSARVATFLAVLELTKSGRIHLNDDNTEIRFNRYRNKKPVETEIDISEMCSVSDGNKEFETETATEDVIDSSIAEQQDTPKPVVKISTERVHNTHIISCPVEIDVEVTNDDAVLETEELETEPDVLQDETTDIDFEFSTLTDPPENIFKPNYWNMRRYFWGKCMVGDDGRNNYWRFG